MTLPLAKLGNSHSLCPGQAILCMLTESKACGTDALFSFREKSVLVPSSATKFDSILRSTLSHAGYTTTNVSTHSFRGGAATFAELDIPSEILNSEGNLRSSCYISYVGRSLDQGQQFSKTLAASLLPSRTPINVRGGISAEQI